MQQLFEGMAATVANARTHTTAASHCCLHAAETLPQYHALYAGRDVEQARLVHEGELALAHQQALQQAGGNAGGRNSLTCCIWPVSRCKALWSSLAHTRCAQALA